MDNIEFAKRCIEDYKSYTCDKCKSFATIENGEAMCKEFFYNDDNYLTVEPDSTCGAWEKK